MKYWEMLARVKPDGLIAGQGEHVQLSIRRPDARAEFANPDRRIGKSCAAQRRRVQFARMLFHQSQLGAQETGR
jgi:hypothetical protein